MLETTNCYSANEKHLLALSETKFVWKFITFGQNIQCLVGKKKRRQKTHQNKKTEVEFNDVISSAVQSELFAGVQMRLLAVVG